MSGEQRYHYTPHTTQYTHNTPPHSTHTTTLAGNHNTHCTLNYARETHTHFKPTRGKTPHKATKKTAHHPLWQPQSEQITQQFATSDPPHPTRHTRWQCHGIGTTPRSGEEEGRLRALSFHSTLTASNAPHHSTLYTACTSEFYGNVVEMVHCMPRGGM